MSPLTPPELARLLDRLEQGSRETSSGFKSGGWLISLLFFGMAAIFLMRGAFGVAALVAAFGAGLLWLAHAASKKTSPERAAPVLTALRTRPEAVTLVRHYVTSSSTGMFATNWLELKTSEGRLVVKAKDDWEPLLVLLVRRCPRATISRPN